MVVEHIVPLAAGGTFGMDNLCLSCYRCNEFKGARQQAPDPVGFGKVSGLLGDQTAASPAQGPGFLAFRLCGREGGVGLGHARERRAPREV